MWMYVCACGCCFVWCHKRPSFSRCLTICVCTLFVEQCLLVCVWVSSCSCPRHATSPQSVGMIALHSAARRFLVSVQCASLSVMFCLSISPYLSPSLSLALFRPVCWASSRRNSFRPGSDHSQHQFLPDEVRSHLASQSIDTLHRQVVLPKSVLIVSAWSW